MEKYNNFKKKYGQNFLTDKNLLAAIVRDAKINNDDQVLEIGAGEGALTQALSNACQKVVSYEIDSELLPILNQKFDKQKNVNIIFGDALKTDIMDIEKNFEKSYHLVANIPYYITSPLIFKFLEESNKILSMTIMIQKEVAERICAKPNTPQYGGLSVICQYYCDCTTARIVSKKMFKPMPKVDSAVIHMDIKKRYNKDFSYLVKHSFSMRRKTLYNNICSAYDISKQKLLDIFQQLNFSATVRAEQLNPQQFCLLCKQLEQFDKIK